MRTLLRWFLRLVFLALFGLGILLGLVYPWAGGGNGFEIGRWRAWDAVTGFREFEMLLPTDQAQIIVKVEVSTPRPVDNAERAAIMTLTVSSSNRTEISQYLSLEGVEPRIVSPQLPARIYTLDAGPLYSPGEAPYRFVFGPGDVEVEMTSADLVLIGGTRDIDEAVPPLGYGLMGIGFIGLVMTFRRRRQNPNSQPPEHRWGRG